MQQERTPHDFLEAGVEGDFLNPIAVIGVSARFPQDATSAEAFWQMLEDGRSAMTEVPEDRFNIDSFYNEDTRRLDTLNARGGHFLKGDLAAFDAPFFSIPSVEAVSLDPQQRGLLEETYKALENAGIAMERAVNSKTSVYVGCFAREYDALMARDPESHHKYQASGAGSAMLSNRVSWFFNFRGPSMTLDTACSSSLNALHLACLSLRNGESTMGVVAGCNVILNPDTISIPLSNLGFLSPDSRCYSFDHRANGYSRGEGIGVIIIKLLSEAVRDGDTIRAVIRATGANQDGRTPGITQPSMKAQEDLIRDTYLSAGLNLGTTRFFEAHGTGTPIGDPIEAGAIGAVFKDQRAQGDPMLVGAVKSNIGHLEGASGIAGVIKTIMVLEKAVIPPNIWFEQPNPIIPVTEWNLKFPVENTQWPTNGIRRASVNSFGYGGANAHAVLDDAYHYMKLHNIRGKHCTTDRPPLLGASMNSVNGIQGVSISNGYHDLPKVFVWTAADEAGLKRIALAYCDFLSRAQLHKDSASYKWLIDLAYTLSCKRSMLPWKFHLVSRSVEELIHHLSSNLTKPLRSSGTAPALGFIFTGQGTQWHAMGRELLAYPMYKESLEQADTFFQSLGCEWSLREELLKDKGFSNVHKPEFAQPLCTAVQVALTDLLASWGIRPSAVLGHSSGEIAAAYCVGGLSRESAWKVAYFRGLVASHIAGKGCRRPGSMMAVAMSEKDLDRYLGLLTETGDLVVGCVNSPINTTVTGTEAAVDALKEIMDREQIFTRKLPVKVAYHSVQMNEVAGDYQSAIRDLGRPAPLSASVQPPLMYSSVTGQLISPKNLCRSEYWISNLVSKVVFSDALSRMCQSANTKQMPYNLLERNNVSHLVEIGPHAALRSPVRETVGEMGYTSVLRKDTSASQTVLDLAGRLCCLGYPIDLLAINNPLGKFDLKMLTNLPAYPFNHSQSYWHESVLSKNFRFRKHSRHELLGTPTVDWNPLAPEWRNIIKQAENPWIGDHKLNGSKLYPAAGMIVMVIEAVRQISTSIAGKHIKGYRFKDIVFLKALGLPTSSEGVETRLYFRPRIPLADSSSNWSDFQLCSLSNTEWVLNWRGTVITEFEESEIEVDHGIEDKRTTKRHRDTYEHGVRDCTSSVDSRQMYESLKTLGYGFGPTFRTLQEVSYSDNREAVARINLHAWKNKTAADAINIQEHVVHPTALDGIFQLTLAAITKGGRAPIPTMIPTNIQNLWISNDLFTKPDLTEIKAYTKSLLRGYHEEEFGIVALDSTTHEPVIVVDHYRATAVTSLAVSMTGETDWRRLCYSIDWKPDLDILDRESLSAYCNVAADSTESSPNELVGDVELVCLYFLSKTLAVLSQEEHQSSGSYLGRYIEWMVHYCRGPNAEAILSSATWSELVDNANSCETMLDNFQKSSPQGNLFVTIGRNLLGILRGEIDVLDLLFKGELLQDFYRSSQFTANYQKIMSYVDLSAHKNPEQSVLEIGAGTGGASVSILEALGGQNPEDDHCTPRYDQYTYTDISPSFFQDAKKRLKQYNKRLLFKTLDIGKDPVQQGFETGKYDMIVASCVLHATTNIDITLRNTHKLLKPGGKLVLLEPCNLDCSRITFVFGLLPGWWLGTEDHRRWGAILSDSMWHKSLQKNGFSGSDVCLRDGDGDRHSFSLIVSTAVSGDPVSSIVHNAPKVVIVMADVSVLQSELAQRIDTEIKARGDSICKVISVREICSYDFYQAFCIFLPELEAAFLHGINSEDFRALKHMVHASSAILWVTHDGGQATQRPELGLATGFGRSMCSEYSSLNFITLALESTPCTAEVANHIIEIIQATVTNPQGNVELEYTEKSGVLCINRLVEANTLNDAIFSTVVPQGPESQKIGQNPERALALTISSPGLLDTLRFIDDTAEDPLGPDEVKIAVRATGVNFKDVMVALGQLPDKSLGQECAGVVTAVGKEVTPVQIEIGDHVVSVTQDAFKTYARSHVSSTYRIPRGMSFTTAAAFPVAFCTAYYALHHLARLKKGESILIHAAAGGVGQAAVQLAKLSGATIYVTVGSDEKKRLLVEIYEISEDRIFSSRNLSFATGIKRMTNNRGVDVVLNSLAGESLRQSLECVAPLGRFIEIGKRDMYLRENLPMSPFLQNISFASVDLRVVESQARSLMAELMRDVMTLATAQPAKLHPPQPLHVFRYSEIERAFRFLQSGKNAGKIVIGVHEDDIIPVVPSTKPSWHFDEEATYVISGGLGGLGRSIARWMAGRKAKYLVLLSRSGTQGEAARSLVEELETKGVRVLAPPCDISDESALISVLTQCAQSFPPIKGCIQGSMVLKDGLFENMTLENFEVVFHPKVRGSWNLHTNLPKELDFLVLLSSTGGIFGSRGQSNYASANTYQDALARYRVSMGQKCVSLNLGLVSEIGFAAEKQEVIDSLSAAGYQKIYPAELYTMLDHCCNPELKLSSPSHSQIVTGIVAPAFVKSQGRDKIFWMSRPLFRNLMLMDEGTDNVIEGSQPSIHYRAMLESCDSLTAAGSVVAQALARKLSTALSMPIEDIETDRPVHAYGVDSLVAVEIRYWFLKEFKAEVAVFDIVGSESIANLSLLGAGKSDYVHGSLKKKKL